MVNCRQHPHRVVSQADFARKSASIREQLSAGGSEDGGSIGSREGSVQRGMDAMGGSTTPAAKPTLAASAGIVWTVWT